jgi:phosphopantetheinyl transferase
MFGHGLRVNLKRTVGPGCLPAERRVDVWVAPVGRVVTDLPSFCLDLLSDVERGRLERLRLTSDRERYLVSRLLLRVALSRSSAEPVEPGDWRFTQCRGGKPMVEAAGGLPSLHFSLSRSRQVAVVAVSAACAVGVDVECLDRATGADPVDLVLSPGERRWLDGRPPAARARDFARLWTVKEAYAKLLGLGLSLDFASFEVALEPVRMVRTETGRQCPKDLYLATDEIRTADGSYQLSLAARRRAGARVGVTLHVVDSRLVATNEDERKEARHKAMPLMHPLTRGA